MKTKLQIAMIALIGLSITSCSSSMYMSKSSDTPTDDIYYTPSKTNSSSTVSDNNPTLKIQNQEPEKVNIAQLEEKYSKILASDSVSIDTLIYKAESDNPYERILSDSYQESYERRLRGMEDPRYGMNNFAIRFSDDYFYASAYDPAFYHIVVMGDQVWVEPNYISSMFSWPSNNFWLGFGIGFGWNSWYYNHYSHYYWNNSWVGYEPYWYGYPANYSTTINNNYYYGRRTGNSTNLTSLNRRTENSYENQIVSSRRRNGTTINAGLNRTDFRTRSANQTDLTTRNGQRNTNQEVIGRGNRNGNLNTTRLRDEATTRNINSTEATRRNNNNTYQRPRSTNTDGYIRAGTRNQNNGTVSRDNTTRGTSTIRDNRTSTPTYNRPNRVDSSTERGRTTNSGSTNRESNYRDSGRNSSSNSNSATRSNSGTSSGSTSSSNTQQSSSSGSTERRR
ncbi:MAG: hypothetical protein EHM93_05085 [Bacteroidales bacterium]|nr:MAG: hypothetical protein EHM93_05085 [Bacteroidales bacterium]